MNEQENVKAVERIYTAFGQGDIQAMLNMLAEDIDWLFPGPADIPFAGRYRGREQVAQFFKIVGETIEIEQFEPQEFITKGDKVVVLGHEQMRVKSSGRTSETDWVHVFTLRNGKVVKIHELYYDIAAIVAAFRSE